MALDVVEAATEVLIICAVRDAPSMDGYRHRWRRFARCRSPTSPFFFSPARAIDKATCARRFSGAVMIYPPKPFHEMNFSKRSQRVSRQVELKNEIYLLAGGKKTL